MFKVESLTILRAGRALCQPVSFELVPKTLLVITGHNGSGKSTLLRTLVGLLTCEQGKISWKTHLIHNNNAFKRQLLYIGHSLGLHPSLRVDETLQGILSSTVSTRQIKKLVQELNLTEVLHTPLEYLSAGQLQKVKLARLSLNQAELWVLDEPLNSLDTASCLWFTMQLEQHLNAGGICIAATHQVFPIDYKATQTLIL